MRSCTQLCLPGEFVSSPRHRRCQPCRLEGCTQHELARLLVAMCRTADPTALSWRSALQTRMAYLVDKELQPVVDDAVKNGLGPGGRSAKLFQHHRRHASVQCLQVVAIPLSICPAFSHLFSEKLLVTMRSGLTVCILTSNQSSEPCGSMM